MKKIASIVVLLLTLGAFSPSAHAIRLQFGTSDKLRRVAETKVKGPGGASLYLAHKITTQSFGLPYTVHSDGLVLASDFQRYFELPPEEELVILQAGGLLPNPLPAAELSWDDYLFGHFLWIVILFILGAFGFEFLRNKSPKENLEPSPDAASTQRTDAQE